MSDPPATKLQVKLLADLATGAGRRREGCCLVEGATLLHEALAAGLVPRLLAVSPEAAQAAAHEVEAARRAGATVVVLTERAAARLSDRERAPGLLAAVPLPLAWDGRVPASGPALLVALCGVQDPGNVGTLLRSALAFDASALLVTPGTADPHGPKVVRASAGAALRLPCAGTDEAALPALAVSQDLALRAATARPGPSGGEAPADTGLPARCLLLLGHETRGVPDVAGALPVRVPQSDAAESLNVAMAGSILMAGWYAAQRAPRGPRTAR